LRGSCRSIYPTKRSAALLRRMIEADHYPIQPHDLSVIRPEDGQLRQQGR
jgi:hypothetical protein